MIHRPLDVGPLILARFVDRPNRFLVRCRVGRRLVPAFLPNPGRMWELLLPDATLYLTRQPKSPARKTSYTAVAVERDGSPVFLHTHATNQVARYLIERRMIPGLETAEVVRAEVPLGHSRFDFLLRQDGREVYAEVKSVTLFGNDVAMFPDAVTERGRRHMLELAALAQRGAHGLVIFLIHSPRVRWFMPDYHTDLEFSKTFLSVRGKLPILPVSVGWNPDLSMRGPARLIDVPWEFLKREVKDRGAYAIVMRLKRRRTIQVGRLGRLAFAAGYHVYVGSAMRALSARVARHLRLRKKLQWHVDYLRQVADEVMALPIRSSRRLECEVTELLSRALQPGPAGFGCSDCKCATHLFHSPGHPLQRTDFLRVVERLRLRPPDC